MTVSIRARILAILAFLSFGLASLSGVPVEPDERKIDPVLMATDVPAVTAVQRKIAGGRVGAQATVPLFIRLASEYPELPDRARELGGAARSVAPRLYTGRIPRDAARYLSNLPEVAFLEAARRARPLLDLSAPAVSADDVHAGSAGWPTPFNAGIRGEGVFVGIVDTGLDDAHLDFHTGGSGSPSRVVHTYSSPQLPPTSSNPLTDENGHGTHVTGIAVGNGFSSGGTYTGMAPDSSILFGKTSFFTTDIVAAVSDFLSFAGATPVSINLSLGLSTGPHDGTSGFEDSLNFLATGGPGSRRLIAVAAGNERTDGEHFRTTLPPFGIVTEFLTLDDTSGATAEIWADGEDRYTVTATLGTTPGGESVTVASGTSGSSGTGRISVSNRTTTPSNGATFISVFFLPQTSGQTGSIQLTRTRNGGTGTVDGYIDPFEGTFDTPTEDGTATEPANADNVIAVGSFDTKIYSFLTKIATPAVQNISSFSSLGPTRDGRIKPDLAAPGSVIFSTRSADAPDSGFIDNVPANDNYAILAGTSMATPHVTGIAALVWESNTALTGAQMRERLRKTADPQPIGSIPPNNTWGHGKVNALRAVTEPVAAISAPRTALPGTIVQVSGIDSSGAFGSTDSLTYAWSLVSQPAGSSLGFSSSLRDDSFTPTVPGNYSVSLTVTQPGPTPGPASDNATIHVNNLPVASITGPPSSDNTDPVTFQGSATDLDAGQPKNFHWILVSKPSESPPGLLTPVAPDNTAATLFPDRAGTYEVGLRVDDGMDNSALATKTYTAGPVASNGGGGGGGCSILATFQQERTPASLSAPALMLLPIMILAIRRSAGKRNGLRKQAHRVIARLTQDVELVEQNRRLGSMGLRVRAYQSTPCKTSCQR